MLPSLPPFMTGAANPSPATGDAPAPSSPTPAPPPAPALAAHRIKSVSYLSNDRQILLQNENGPCPLLAAANCLLLRGLIELPARCLRAGSASIDDIINVLAERALARSQTEQQRRGGEGGRARGTGEGGDDGAALLSARHHLDEVLSLIPGLQHGMDLNPRFSAGPTGVEYTANLACFDLLGVDLVHGWLLDEQDVETASVVGDRTYNELVEVVISGGEAGEEVGRLGATIAEKQAELARAEGGGGMSQAEAEGDANAGPGPGLGAQELQRELDDLRQRYEELSDKAHEGHLAGAFLSSTSHQLTYHGLAELHRRLEDHVLCVFFRNNHFATLAKEDGTLYLLVTDLGYANVPEVVWEKLDVIDGSTDLYDEYFSRPEPRRELAPATTPALSPKDMVGQGGQDDADYRLAVELSRRQEGAGGGGGGGAGGEGAKQEGRLIAAATEASIRDWHDSCSTSSARHRTSPLEQPAQSPGPPVLGVGSSDVVDVGVPRTTAAVDGQWPTPSMTSPVRSDEEIARALQKQMDADGESEALARLLQDEEERLAAGRRQQQQQRHQQGRTQVRQGAGGTAIRSGASDNKSNCAVS